MCIRDSATPAAQARLQAAWPKLTVQTWLDQAPFYRSVRDLYNRIFGALGLIIGVIVVFVVTNAMAMAIIERTREIGTLRAMGTLPSQLLRTLALEGMVLGGVGALAGAALSLGISLLLYVVPRFSRIFEDMGTNIPALAKLLVKWGGFVNEHGETVLIVGGALATLFLV